MDGIIVVNKPKGCTSHDVVYKVKKITGEKVGHTGTLDPNATGVLPLLIGKGTLLSKYLINHDKTYEVTLQLGEKTDTADSEGNVIEQKEIETKIFNEDNIKNVLDSFIGKHKQIPPMYSAIKVNGKKLYEYARKKEKVEVPPRNIEIYNIKLIKLIQNNNEIQFEVSCSKGTYIRSLCEDIAERINTVGYMKDLKRIQVGEFSIDEAVTINELEQVNDINKIKEKYLISIEDYFNNNKELLLNEIKLKKFVNGVKLKYDNLEDGLYRIYDNNKNFIGLGIINNKNLKRDIVVKNIENN